MKFTEIFLQIANNYNCLDKGYFLLPFIPEEIVSQDIDTSDVDLSHARYFYGMPFTNAGLPFAIGTPQMLYVKMLFDIMHDARVALGEEKFRKYCQYLFNKAKHQDAVNEFRPVTLSKPFLDIEYEVPGSGNYTIDWKFTYSDCVVLVEVKNRSGNTFRHLATLVEPPTTIPEEFFKSTDEKFLPNEAGNLLQGVWVHIGIKESKEALSNHFVTKIDSKKVQFFVIAGWDSNECYIEARTEEQKKIILDKFQLVESNRFVF